jgi:glutamyl-tRNA synthetase
MTRFLFVDTVEVDEAARTKVLNKDPELTHRVLAKMYEVLEAVVDWTTANIEAAVADVPEALEAKPRLVFQPLRVAVSGSQVSPPLNESMELLGKERTLARIKALI